MTVLGHFWTIGFYQHMHVSHTKHLLNRCFIKRLINETQYLHFPLIIHSSLIIFNKLQLGKLAKQAPPNLQRTTFTFFFLSSGLMLLFWATPSLCLLISLHEDAPCLDNPQLLHLDIFIAVGKVDLTGWRFKLYACCLLIVAFALIRAFICA